MGRASATLIGCAVFLTAGLLLEQQSAVYRIANAMLGESWYRIELNGEHVGFMYNNTYMDHKGQWHFVSTTHFLLQDNAPNTISKRLTFGTRGPYPLVSATYTHDNAGQTRSITVDRGNSGYTAQLERSRQRNSRNAAQTKRMELDWSFDLESFLGFEQWLSTNRPDANSQHLATSPDFERLRLVQRTYRIVTHNEQGYLVETNAPFAATQTQLDKRFRPIRMNMAGIFDVIATNEADAISLKRLRRKTQYTFELDRRLHDHTSLAALHLGVDGPPDVLLPRELKLTHNPVISNGTGDEYNGEELRYPITHPFIQKLVQMNTDSDPMTTVKQLVHTTNQQMEYAENQPAGSVLTALAEGRGECTDYADLFTTLARAAGFPARNIYGLAYRDGSQPAFMFHAWNEVFAAGKWHTVDATWNQIQVDATHIPLSDTQAARMMLADNTGGVRFRVLGTEYF